jgi:predicted NBD/HSP70 family sugar kinase
VSLHIGVDIGGTKAEAVLTDANGEVSASHRVATGRGNDAVVASAVAAVEGVLAAAHSALGDVASMGVGVPGAVSNGVVSHAVNLGIERLALADELAQAWGITPVVENDVNAAAVGAWALMGDGARSMAYLNLGTGLAAGIVLDGKLWKGARGAAGEIGHVSVDPAGPTGPDGLPGGLEAYAGGGGIAFAAGTGRSAAEILADPAHDQVRRDLYFGVASAIRVLVLTLDVEQVVLGGGLTRLGAPLVDGVTAQLAAWASESAFLASVDLGGRFTVLEPGTPVAAVGAAMLGVEMLGAGRG